MYESKDILYEHSVRLIEESQKLVRSHDYVMEDQRTNTMVMNHFTTGQNCCYPVHN